MQKTRNLAVNVNEIPVGAILVKDGKLISQAHNKSLIHNDPSAHAEIVALRKAGKKLQNYRLADTTLYVTLEPCAMCLGALIHARIERLVFGAPDPKSGISRSSANLLSDSFFNHKIIVSGGIL